jgi:hypothetical protein
MSSKLAKRMAAAFVIEADLGVLLRSRLAEQAALSRDGAGPPPEVPAALLSGPEFEAVTCAQPYQEARCLGVRGRSKMTKAQLKAAVSEGGRT